MKTMKKNKFLQIGLIILAAICACLCFWVAPMEQSIMQAVAGENATQNVYIGDTFEAKDYKMLSVDGDVMAEGMRITYPNGGIYSSEKLVIEQAGKYEVTYYATVNGTRVEETYTYLAIRRPQDMIVASASIKVEYGKFFVNESPYDHKYDTYGVKVHFKAGQSITFATNLKTADLTENFNFLEMLAQPSVYGETDFERLVVRLTDVGNETNYMEYVIESSDVLDGNGQVSYVRAGATNRRYGGYEGTRFHVGTHYGSQVEHSFRGWGCLNSDRAQLTVSETALTLAFDQESKQVFCGPHSSTWAKNNMVNDLDDEAHYKSDPWGGFTGEEVSVTITAEKFSKGEGVLFIKSYAGYNLAKDVVDNNAPEIYFDYDMTESLPVAEVGSCFEIIPFTAKDNLDKGVKTSVWVNYLDENGKKITVANDGKSFMVDYAGTYEIIYRAEDYSGNVAEKRLEIKAQDAAPNIYVSIDKALIEKDVYGLVEIPFASQMSVYGGSGALSVERAVYSPSKKLLNVKDTLELEEVGDYKVIYTATDYYGNSGYGVVTIRSNAIDAPKFIDEPDFTDVLLGGFTYEFPKAFVIETVGTKVIPLTCKTYVNGELKEGSFMVNGEEAVIRYVAEGETGSIEWEKTIPVVVTEKGRYKSNYFYTEDDLQIVDEKTYLGFTINDDAQATFLNSLSSKNFSVMFEYSAENMNFSEMHFIMTDAENKSLSVTFRLVYDKALGQWFMYMNNSEEKINFAESKGILSFAYSPNGNKVIDTSGDAIAVITAYDNGKEFNGFSDMVYFDVVFANVERESSIRLTQICNQSMGYNKSSLEKAKDEISPIIVLDDVMLLRQPLGSKANIPTARAFDVLSSVVTFTLTVELEGRVIASGNPEEPMDLMLDKAGYYSVTYFAEDTNGNTYVDPYLILVADTTAPTLTVKNTLKNTYKVGDKVKIPTYSATDNDENCYIQVMVLLPDNEMRLLHYSKNGEVTSLLDKDHTTFGPEFKAGSDTFVTSKKGKYVLRFVAYDDYYNYTVKEFEFWVK